MTPSVLPQSFSTGSVISWIVEKIYKKTFEHMEKRWPFPVSSVWISSGMTEHCGAWALELSHSLPAFFFSCLRISVSVSFTFWVLTMLFQSTNFTEKYYILYLFSGNFPLQRTLKYPFSKKMDSVYFSLLSLAHKFDLAVCFCSIIVKIVMYWTGTGTIGKYCPSTAVACELP